MPLLTWSGPDTWCIHTTCLDLSCQYPVQEQRGECLKHRKQCSTLNYPKRWKEKRREGKRRREVKRKGRVEGKMEEREGGRWARVQIIFSSPSYLSFIHELLIHTRDGFWIVTMPLYFFTRYQKHSDYREWWVGQWWQCGLTSWGFPNLSSPAELGAPMPVPSPPSQALNTSYIPMPPRLVCFSSPTSLCRGTPLYGSSAVWYLAKSLGLGQCLVCVY